MPRVLRRRRSASHWTRPKGRVDSRSLWWWYRGRWGLFEICATPGLGCSLAQVEYQGEVIVWPPARLERRGGSPVKKKKKPADAVVQKHLAAVESNVLRDHAAIVAHCSVTQYDDGDPRKPGWITVKTFGSVWQLEAKDPDECLTLRVVQPSLDDALGLLNLLLESEDAPWEPDPWLAQQAAKNRKKG